MSLYNDKMSYARMTGQWDAVYDEEGNVIDEVPGGRFRYPERKERTLMEF
jgi:hypothetical protein